MQRVYSNGPLKDFVLNPFNKLLAESSSIHLAAPYFTQRDSLVEAAGQGKSLQVLIGLNSATSPKALSAIHGLPNLAVRYLTHRFHAKIFIFDNAALIGSSNLTDGGLVSNREATLCLDQPEDAPAVDEIRALFQELWDSALVLTDETLENFQTAHASVKSRKFDADGEIEKAVGRAEPANIRVKSERKTAQRVFLEGLRRQVYEEYRPAFDEVTAALESSGFRREELDGIGSQNETNRFLNWVRLTYVPREEIWRSAPLRSLEERNVEVLRLGKEWADADNNKVPDHYLEWLNTVQDVFGKKESILSASKDRILEGLMSIHAFDAQSRWIGGGAESFPAAFWEKNEDVDKLKNTLVYLVHGDGDFINRFHDVLYDPSIKPGGNFGYFSALELFGTIHPELCPPLNGRMAKALRYLGFDVRPT